MNHHPSPTDTLGAPPGATRCAGVFTALLLRCAGGDESAMAALFDAFLPVVLPVVHRRTTSGSTDDQVVAAFVRIWRRASLFDPTATSALEWILDQARWSDDPRPPLPLTAARAC